MPETDGRLHANVHCETLRTALDRMVTTKSEPGILFTFRRGSLALASRAKEYGQSKAAIPVAFNGTAEFIFDATFIRDFLRSLDADTAVDIHMSIDKNEPVLFVIGDGKYRYVVQPMIRDEKTAGAKTNAETEIAEPDADTGDEVVGTESTMEEPMKDTDEFPCPDDDTDLQTRFFQLQMENDQLQAKVEHYKTLLNRAMRVIERMKSEQRVCV